MILKVGKKYVTRGGWTAKVIWKVAKDENYYYVIHKPREEEESVPICHTGDGVACDAALGVNMAPTYGQHPADIIKLKIKK